MYIGTVMRWHCTWGLLAALLLSAFLSPLPEARIDRNASGMSDVWEAAYGVGLNPHVDLDGDGFTNLEESIAGTNPHDAQCFPRAGTFSLVAAERAALRIPSIAGVSYQVEVSVDHELWQPVGAPVIGSGGLDVFEFDLSHTFIGSTLRRSVWTDLTGGGLPTLKSYVANGTPPPALIDTLTALDIPQSDPDEDDFGQHVRGWLLPPATGFYTFWIASDDHSELWLSNSSDPADKALIAGVPGWTAYREWDKYPEQASAPIFLEANRAYFIEVFHREGWGGDHLTVAWTRPDGAPGAREILATPHFSSTGQSLRDLAADEGRLLFRLRVFQVDTDGDGVTDYEEHLLGLNPFSLTSTPRQPDLSAALQILDSANQLTIGATTPRAYAAEGAPGRFTLYRAGGIEPLTIAYSVAGTALPGVDYAPLSGTVTLSPGARTAFIDVPPLPPGALPLPPRTVVLTLEPHASYLLGSPAAATVTIDDAMDVLFVAQLRPADGVISSGMGLGSVRRAGNALSGRVSLSFSGLAGEQLAAELLISSNGLAGPVALDLPLDQVPPMDWLFDPINGLTSAAIIEALDNGQLWVRIRSSAYPGGELVGQLQLAPGWDVMPEPPTPAAAPTTPDGDVGEASRFLAQATFGPTEDDLVALLSSTYSDWIDAQLALPSTDHLSFVQHRRAELLARDGNDGWQRPRQEAWWQHALTAPDQLRQRMAFALSQIFVVSQFGALDGAHEGTTLYYDQLLEHAFGNYRDLLEAVTLSPMMGAYLSMMRNQKPDPVTGHEPDENYAREVMQLFSVGLIEMHNDGSLRLDAEGMPIATYTQQDTVELAHIFTGWSAHYDPEDPPRWSNGNVADPAGWFYWGWDPMRPMSFYPSFHDTQERVLLGGATVPAGTNGILRMSQALDALFHHPNVGPFMARQLIQRFVTSNPSPGYIHRVASVFNDNGSGVRGDLGATLRAVLLDPEARNPGYREGVGYGKPAEPVLRVSRMLRGFPPPAPFADEGDPRLFLNYQWSLPEQVPLYASSVFNFFQPVYRQPGRIARAGLLSPEFQIFAETTAIRQANLNFSTTQWGIWTPEPDGEGGNVVLRLDLDPLVAILEWPGLTPLQAQALLLDHLDDRLLFGAMSAELRADIEAVFASFPGWYDFSEDRQRARARTALYLILNSPEFFVQR